MNESTKQIICNMAGFLIITPWVFCILKVTLENKQVLENYKLWLRDIEI